MHAGVPFTLLAAGAARGGAGLEDGAGEVGVVAGVPGEHLPGGVADVRTVEVAADTLNQVGHVLLAQANVSAGGTRLGAVVTGLDAARKRGAVHAA